MRPTPREERNRLLGASLLAGLGAGPLLAAQAEPAPRDHALLVGCTYADQPARLALAGCANDVDLVRSTLVSELGVAPDDVVALVEGRPDSTPPTYAAVTAALADLGERARRGDRVFLFFAGHGTQQPDGRDQDEPDGFDEVFLCSDVGKAKRVRGRQVIENALTDDELYATIEKLLAVGVQVALLSDCCHSATLGRGAGASRTRGIDPAHFGFDVEVGGRGGRVREAPGDALPAGGFVGVYAVQADEKAQETPIDLGGGERRPHGIFTWSLVQALSRAGEGASFDDLFRLVTASYRELGFHDITPFVHGSRDARLRPGGAVDPTLWAEVRGGRVEVDAGLLAGVYPGSRLEALDEAGANVLGELQVAAASSFRAECVAPQDTAVPRTEHARFRVRVVETPAGGRPLGVSWGGEAEPPWLDELEKLDPNGARVRRVAPTGADWGLERGSDAWLLRPSASGSARRYRVPAGNVAATLLDLHRVSSLLRLPARSAPLPEGLQLEVRLDGRALTNGEVVRPGSNLTITAFNGTAQPLDAWVFWIDSDHGVTRVFPDPDEPDAAPFLVPARKTRQQAFQVRAQEVPRVVTDGAQGAEHFLFVALPAGGPDLAFLATDALTPDARGELEPGVEVWDELAFGPDEGTEYGRGLGAGTHVELLTLRMSWEPLVPPAALEARALALPAPEAVAVEAAAGEAEVPSPWELGSEAAVVEVAGARVVADSAQDPRLFLIDLDPPSLVTDEELSSALAARTWEAELALFFDQGSARRVVFYATGTHAGPRFDLVRVDDDGDGRADAAFRYGTDGWTRDGEPAAPVLRLAELDFVAIAPRSPYAAEDAALALVRELFCPDDNPPPPR